MGETDPCMEVRMADRAYRFAFKRLDVYRLAVEHFQWTCAVVDRMPKGPFVVVRQAVGASLSIMGNIGEGTGRSRKYGEVEQHFRYAQGSTFEAATHLDAFRALKVIDAGEYDAAEQRLARIAAMITALMRRQRDQKGYERRRRTPDRRSEANASSRTSAERTPRGHAVTEEDRTSATRTRQGRAATAADRPTRPALDTRPSPPYLPYSLTRWINQTARTRPWPTRTPKNESSTQPTPCSSGKGRRAPGCRRSPTRPV